MVVTSTDYIQICRMKENYEFVKNKITLLMDRSGYDEITFDEAASEHSAIIKQSTSFSKFLSDEKLNINQIRFVNLIIDYIVENGNIEDNSVLMNEPFRSLGSITVLFKDDLNKAKDLMNVVDEIRNNSQKMA